jgi:ribosomal protein S12 methylthiotransferase
MLPLELREVRKSRFMAVAQAVSAQKNKRLVGSTMQVLVDSAQSMGRAGGVGRSYRDAPEIDGIVRLIPPQRISKTFRTGEFIKVKILESNGHELVGMPI